jgi:hypothetical protein
LSEKWRKNVRSVRAGGFGDVGYRRLLVTAFGVELERGRLQPAGRVQGQAAIVRHGATSRRWARTSSGR